MKHIYSLAAAVFLAAALSSCAKMRVETEDVRPAGTPIRMAVSSEGAQTKALFDAASFSAKGNVLQIWDVYFNSVVAPQAYIEGANVVSTDTGWPFKEGDAVSSPDKHYYWTKTGTHRFYGVLVKDNSAGLTPDSGWGFDAAHKVYSVPTTTLTLTSPQFDFVYSNVIERNLDNGDPTTAVPLKFNHLFSAFGFTFKNDSPSSFNIKSATLKVNDQAAATIDYSNVWDKNFAPADADNWNPVVTYTGLTMSSTTGISGKIGEIQAGTCYDMFQGGLLDKNNMAKYDKYTLIWPQDLTGKTLEMKYLVSGKRYQEVDVTVNKYTYTTSSGNGNYDVSFTDNLNFVTSSGDKSFDYNKENGYYVYVGRGKGNYAVRWAYKSYGGNYTRSTITDKESQLVDYTEEKTVTKNLKDITPGGTWLAGNRYLYKLVFSDNEVNLVVSVMKWEDGHGGNVTFQ